MDDEYYDRDGHDDGQFFADTEEEAHFFSVIYDFIGLMDIYSPELVMKCVDKIKQKEEVTLNSIN